MEDINTVIVSYYMRRFYFIKTVGKLPLCMQYYHICVYNFPER